MHGLDIHTSSGSLLGLAFGEVRVGSEQGRPGPLRVPLPCAVNIRVRIEQIELANEAACCALSNQVRTEHMPCLERML